MTDSSRDYIRSQVSVTPSGCWEWNGRRNPVSGYGVCSKDMGAGYAHRASYEIFVAPIPDGLQIDHLCRNRSCVNPAHLEAVTASENVRRSPIHSSRINAAKTHCPAGHEYSQENTYLRPDRCSGRDCKKCRAAATRRSRRRRLAEATS